MQISRAVHRLENNFFQRKKKYDSEKMPQCLSFHNWSVVNRSKRDTSVHYKLIFCAFKRLLTADKMRDEMRFFSINFNIFHLLTHSFIVNKC